MSSKLSDEEWAAALKEIDQNFLNKPCLKCGENDHPLALHFKAKKEVKNRTTGSVWKRLNMAEQAAAQKHLKKVVDQYNEAKRAAAGAGTSQAAASAGSSQAAAAQIIMNPIIAPAIVPPAFTGTDPYVTVPDSTLTEIHDVSLDEPIDAHLPAPGYVEDKKDAKFRPASEFQVSTVLTQVSGSKYPLRKKFATTNSSVLTNHFGVSWKPDTQFFIYEITNIPAGTSKRQCKVIVKAAIRAWDFLRDNKDFFTTDHLKHIVSWKNLHESISCPRKADVPNELVWNPPPLLQGEARRIYPAFKHHGTLNLDRLTDFINGNTDQNTLTQNPDMPNFNFNPLVAHLNSVISKSLLDDVFSTSSHRFYIKNGWQPLGRSKILCTMRGYDYTIKPAMQKVLLNVNAATSAFYLPITVSEFLRDNETFTASQLERRIKRLRVYIMPDRQLSGTQPERDHANLLNQTQHRIKTVKGLGPSIDNLTFRKDSSGNQQLSQITHVKDHMTSTFGHTHGFDRKKRAVNVGSDTSPVWYPQEFLRIVPYQMYNNLLPDHLVEDMLKVACNKPRRVRRLIEEEGLPMLGIVLDKGKKSVKNADVLEIEPGMVKIPSTKMDAVHIHYQNDHKKPSEKAQWNITGTVTFLRTPNLKDTLSYYMIFAGVQNDKLVSDYKSLINEKVKSHGISREGASCVATAHVADSRKEIIDENGKKSLVAKTHLELTQDMKHAIEACQNTQPGGQLVILVLPKKQIPPYSAFKDAADRDPGLQALCITKEKNQEKSREDIQQYISNVAMKINLKLGGINHTVADGENGVGRIRDSLVSEAYPKRPVMILGADVTHPGSGSLVGCPSVAALVGSVDADHGRFLGSLRLQSKSNKEMIDVAKMEAMAQERIGAWMKGNAVPDILYYRDGVSTGQFDAVLAEEVEAIKRAWKKASRFENSNVNITVVIAVKRHHTRFFPENTEDGNCKPGTLVDRAIVSPYFCEFFLQSHHALQGTAVPTRYFVIKNDLKLSDTDLQRFTHKLCYTYARATVGVSYAPPAYYADRLCERGRQYLRDWFSPNYDSDHYHAYQQRKRDIKQRHQTVLTQAVAQLQQQAQTQATTTTGQRRSRKPEGQAELERTYRQNVQKDLEAAIHAEATDYWNEHRDDGPGPWHESLDKTMFWM